ncbi:6-phosphogluconate dehydrogenase C-terminal domain-like protein [Terfezia boudieri ATCC MYA-4762]|uniref:6-phosphogluconate dehydrogenase C-terminal domain-like protein n=1 Tax=Terfezia boudieri ATCC MYA-4762 TaxID=1051890 RepID=A0A3N4L948_9PEZI|nr:6-phosphogluconate dehydrogenase C-terminal domain-like protein [Terfezia boudieri ATCC MYA-4762]
MTAPPPPRIHIVGLGNLGCLVAHALRSIHPRRPVTLFTHKTSVARMFDSHYGGLITVERNRLAVSRKGFDVEISSMAIENLLPYAKPLSPQKEDEKIDHLIVTTRAPHAKKALQPLIRRLTPQSTIAFVQNGLEVVEEINSLYFPDPETRPNYLLGVWPHGIFSPKEPLFEPFRVVIGSSARLKLGVMLPTIEGLPDLTKTPAHAALPPTAAYLLSSLLSAEDLAGMYVAPQEVIASQLERFALNAVIYPLTVMFDCQNGALLHNSHAAQVVKVLLHEISKVFCKLPELEKLHNKELRFSEETLYNTFVKVVRYNGEKESPMLQEVKKGIPTEVEYLNGWIVRKGEELGVECKGNYMMFHVVKAKEKMAARERERELPIEGLETNF